MKRYSKSGKRWRSRRRLFTGLYCVLALFVMLAAAWKLDLIGWKASKEPLIPSSAAKQQVIWPIRSAPKLGKTQSIPAIMVLSAEPNLLAVRPCRMNQSFPNSHLWTVSETESATVYSTPPESSSKIQDEITTGTPLPAVHGMDTTLFRVAVGLLVITAAVLMISKKTLSTIY